MRKGFVNMEKAPFGGVKLRIPTLLFVEKMRTQSRFNVSAYACPCAWLVLKLSLTVAAHAHGVGSEWGGAIEGAEGRT